VQLVNAVLGIAFTALAASMGAEMEVGQSALEPVYNALGFSWKTFLVGPLELEITAGLVVVGILVVLLFPSRKPKPT
jgi:hypothetical protein